jgi:hypothetical protein
MIALVLCSAALAACSALSGLRSSDKPKVAFESNPPGANVFLSPGNASCKTPCSVPAPEKTGSYNAMFVLAGYIQQSVPVRVSTGKEHWYSSEAVEVSPNPVTVVLKPEPGAPTTPIATLLARRRPQTSVRGLRSTFKLAANLHRYPTTKELRVWF